jgi:hypothetical protein
MSTDVGAPDGQLAPDGQVPAPGGPVTTSRLSTGPISTGLISTGPISDGPISTGPISAGPISAGPISAGPISDGPISGPISGERRGDLLAENTRLQTQLDGLHRALRSRAAIEQAKGVVMAFGRCSEADAFAVLTRLSQQRNVRIRVLAEELLRLAAAGFPETDEASLAGWLRAQVLALGVTGPSRPLPHPNSRR